MTGTREANLRRLGEKICSNRSAKSADGSVLSPCSSRSSFSSDIKMNHEKRAEPGRRIIREIIKRST